MNAFLFVDYKFFGTIESTSLLQAMASHQFRNANTEEHVYTALDPINGYAFSQMYQKLGNGKAQHGVAFKHEKDSRNPEPIPSYQDLVKCIPICLDDSCDAKHCPKCGAHKVDWYAEGLCDVCKLKEDAKS